MKKFLAIIVLGLFWCNAGLAKDIYLSCKGGNSFIINDKTKKIIMLKLIIINSNFKLI